MEKSFKFNILTDKPLKKIEISFDDGFVKNFTSTFEDGTSSQLSCRKDENAEGIEIIFKNKNKLK